MIENNLQELKKKIKEKMPLIKNVLSFLIFLLLGSLVTILLIISLGLSEQKSMHVGILLGLIITIFILRISPFSPITKRGTTSIIKESIAFLILVELALLAITPLHSLVPEPILLNLHIIQNVDNVKSCNTQVEVDLAENFMKANVDLTKIKIYYGGNFQLIPVFGTFLSKAKATAYGNYIYISKAGSCVNSAILVHELTHVWQYQNGMGFGLRWVPYWTDYYWKYLTNYNSLYDFGGVEGIKKAMSEGKNLTDFGLEQQANIVEAYYIMISTSYFTGISHLSRPETFNILSSFVQQRIAF